MPFKTHQFTIFTTHGFDCLSAFIRVCYSNKEIRLNLRTYKTGKQAKVDNIAIKKHHYVFF